MVFLSPVLPSTLFNITTASCLFIALSGNTFSAAFIHPLLAALDIAPNAQWSLATSVNVSIVPSEGYIFDNIVKNSALVISLLGSKFSPYPSINPIVASVHTAFAYQSCVLTSENVFEGDCFCFNNVYNI